MTRHLTALVLGVLFLVTGASAELYVAGDAALSRFAGPSTDGTWKQDHVPDGSRLEPASLGWNAGLGYRFPSWSVEAGYRDWGSVGVGGKWVSDAQYTAVNAHGAGWLEEHCVTGRDTSVVDKLAGGYLRATKGFDIAGFEPFVSAGVFVAQHRVYMNGSSSPLFTGMVAGPTVGGGIKYDIYQGIKVRVTAESHWTVTESQHPVSSQWYTVGGGLEIPLFY